MIEGMHTTTREEHHREHTIKRLEERWEVVISHERYEQLCQVIRDAQRDPDHAQAFRVQKLSRDASVYLLAIESKQIPVVFSHISQQISTAWPIERLRRLSKHYQESLYIRHKFRHHLPKAQST